MRPEIKAGDLVVYRGEDPDGWPDHHLKGKSFIVKRVFYETYIHMQAENGWWYSSPIKNVIKIQI